MDGRLCWQDVDPPPQKCVSTRWEKYVLAVFIHCPIAHLTLTLVTNLNLKLNLTPNLDSTYIYIVYNSYLDCIFYTNSRMVFYHWKPSYCKLVGSYRGDSDVTPIQLSTQSSTTDNSVSVALVCLEVGCIMFVHFFQTTCPRAVLVYLLTVPVCTVM